MERRIGSSYKFAREEHKDEHSSDHPIKDLLSNKPFIQGRFSKLKEMQ